MLLAREVVREHVPLAAGAGQVEDGVEDLPHVDLAGPPDVEDGDQRLDDGPLLVGQVGGVGLTHRGMLRRRLCRADLLRMKELMILRNYGIAS